MTKLSPTLSKVAPSIRFRAVVEGVELTDRQSDLLVFCILHTLKKSLPPTVREIMAGMGLQSPAPVQQHLDTLRVLGVVNWQIGCARSLKITADVKLEIIGGNNYEWSDSTTDGNTQSGRV
jgi:SOS-response transcriptional repressor LexA